MFILLFRRYGEKKRHGRPMLDGEYTPSKPNIPMYKRMWNPSNPWSTSNNLSQLDAMDEVGIEEPFIDC